MSTQAQNQYLDYLTDASFQGVNSLFFSFFSKPLFRQKEKLNLKTYKSTYWIYIESQWGKKLKNIKRKENIIILKIYT